MAATTVPEPVVPKGEYDPEPTPPSFSVPTLMVVKPVYVLFPETVQVPPPFLVTVPVLVPITPPSAPLPAPSSTRA